MSRIAILGAGAFGTALGVSLARAGRPVTLVARSDQQADRLRSDGRNAARLPGIDFPEPLSVSSTLPADADIVLSAIPTQAQAAYLAPLADALSGRAVVACNKGIDRQTGLGPTGIIAAACPDARAAILSGPSFAIDIASGLPTALTLAAPDATLAEDLRNGLSTPDIRLYSSTDVVGVELGGALKNVMAIAAGLALGAGLGESARAALITRGYAEMTRFAVADGARPETLAGLSGFGDLVLTCTSEKSRNFSHGLAIGQGKTLPGGVTVEGVETAKIVSELAKRRGLETPITDLVNAVLGNRISIDEARAALLSRPLKRE